MVVYVQQSIIENIVDLELRAIMTSMCYMITIGLGLRLLYKFRFY